MTKKCFVLMPFTAELNDIYLTVYKPVCESNDIQCQRADETLNPGVITKQICEGILDADIIIADITDHNPNVFYELGFAQTLAKPTIITNLDKPGNRFPFDIRAYTIIRYEQTPAGMDVLTRKLDSTIKEVFEEIARVSNPIWDVLDKKHLIMADKRTPVLDKDKIMRLIKLHEHSSEHLIFSAVIQTMYEVKVNENHYDIDIFTDNLFTELMRSKENCRGFRGKVIGDVYQFLKERFTREQLRATLEKLKPEELAKGDLLIVSRKVRILINKEVRKNFRKIEEEIDEREE
ncbi:MAG TPA: hypothetical protein VGX24_00300 [Pyrinomonadaceae bacterium]|jgi:hypothetical protein|nr:hypothetical protein [Pyrinomonadaceae bacterium]